LELLAAAGAPTVPAPGPGELVTPTGAALLAELADFSQPRMTLQRIGYGAGRKDFPWPNVARLWIGEEISTTKNTKREKQENPWQSTESMSSVSRLSDPQPSAQSASSAFHSSLVVIETNIDDMNPELYEPVRERLFGAGALDVWTTAIGMKKGRPGTLLSVLAAAEKEAELARLILQETTTLGVRVYPVTRHIAERAFETVETVYGPVAVKVKLLDGVRVGAKPEFDDCQGLADTAGVPVRMVYEAALAAAPMPAIEERTHIEIHG
ncbi:MAG: LarC family nickel insertion protein, partial [Caldilineaceae bacterium]